MAIVIRSREKAHPNMLLSECQQLRNHQIAKIRGTVEHMFGAIEQMKEKAIRTIGQFRAKLCDDYDGYLLQSQAIGLLPKGWN